MHLNPVPKSLVVQEGRYRCPERLEARLDFKASKRFRAAMKTFAFIRSGDGGETASEPIALRLDDSATADSPEQYRLAIETAGIWISAGTETGLFRGLTTLKQIIDSQAPLLPCILIDDTPDLQTRGYMLDISRCKVPTQESLYSLVDTIATLKYNQFQLYTEHVFAYRDHKIVWENASPMTSEEIRALDSYCSDRYIELVPNQNSFGHMDRWLRHDAYKHLAECPDGYEHPLLGRLPWGGTLKPNHASIEFVAELFDELLPNFTSAQFNIGGDEPWELGQGWSKELVKRRGKHRVYLDHLLDIHRLLSDRGKIMQFWSDIVLEEPAIADELPGNTLGLVWGYEADHPFEQQCQAFEAAPFPYCVAPGTAAWNSIGGRIENALANIENACLQGMRFNAQGMLLTEWGDFGHHQFPPTSYPAIVWAAALSWNYASKGALNLPHLIDAAFFQGGSRSIADAIIRLSDITNAFAARPKNRTLLNDALFAGPAKIDSLVKQTSEEELRVCLDRLRQFKESMPRIGGDESHARLAAKELNLSAGLLERAANKCLARLTDENKSNSESLPKLKASFKNLWLARNRPGGLEESLAYL